MEKKTKLIHFTYVWTSSSVSSFIANIAEELADDFDQKIIVWDDRGTIFDKRIKDKGIEIISLCNKESHGLTDLPIACAKFSRCLHKFKPEIVHLHCSTSPELRLLKTAKDAHVPVRIAHSHEMSFYGNKFSKYIKEQVHIAYRDEYLPFSTQRLAESKTAGDWLFNGLEYSIVNTPIEIGRYSYDESKRRQFRDNHGIPLSSFVFCSTGRLDEQSNPLLLIEAFSRFHQKRPDSFLILIGESSISSSLNEAIVKYGTEHCILFTGATEDLSSVLSASDGYVLLSNKPIYGITALEAQANGLPCLLSDNISLDVDLVGSSIRNSWDASPVLWTRAMEILTEMKRYDGPAIIKSNGFSKEKVASYLAMLYHYALSEIE